MLVFLLLSYKIFLHILDLRPLPKISLENIFSKSVSLLSTLMTVYFTEFRLAVLMKLPGFFFHMDCTFGVESKNSWSLGHIDFLLCFLLRILHFIYLFIFFYMRGAMSRWFTLNPLLHLGSHTPLALLQTLPEFCILNLDLWFWDHFWETYNACLYVYSVLNIDIQFLW